MITGTKRISRGFTIVELLVVIAVIGILTALIIAAVGKARLRARVTKVHAGLKSLGG